MYDFSKLTPCPFTVWSSKLPKIRRWRKMVFLSTYIPDAEFFQATREVFISSCFWKREQWGGYGWGVSLSAYACWDDLLNIFLIACGAIGSGRVGIRGAMAWMDEGREGMIYIQTRQSLQPASQWRLFIKTTRSSGTWCAWIWNIFQQPNCWWNLKISHRRKLIKHLLPCFQQLELHTQGSSCFMGF